MSEELYDLVRKVKNHETILMTDTLKKVTHHKRLVDKTHPKQIKGNRATYSIRLASTGSQKYKKPPNTMDLSGDGQGGPRLIKWDKNKKN
jgi:hypothetical protein